MKIKTLDDFHRTIPIRSICDTAKPKMKICVGFSAPTKNYKVKLFFLVQPLLHSWIRVFFIFVCRPHVRDFPRERLMVRDELFIRRGFFFCFSLFSHFFFILMCAPCPSIERWMARYCGCKKSSFHHKFTSLIFSSVSVEVHSHFFTVHFGPPHELSRITFHRIFDCFFLHSFLVLSFDFNWRFYDFSHSSCIYHNIQKLFSCCGPWLTFESSSFSESVVLGEMNVKWTITRWLNCHSLSAAAEQCN